eukprot:gnl/Hemi2/27921_TR9215_c0_g2_i1.p1 gnl/Hemi2/27921_TR9215_c0_g2~~gnl/Hemi2/27921_TR9215_c0_g2_i1.p1  ORF type:complete len:251 (+),score=72.01 gnl/Hemi2/27921_TR9215_c0_g2_i1:60-812(+)
MTSIGTGYDLSVTTFSPDGHVFQVEYANKAVENSNTCVGVRCKDGVIMGVKKVVISKMMVEGSNRRIYTVEPHCGIALSGLVADSRQIVNRARAEAKSYRQFYGEAIPPHVLAARVASYVHTFTLYWHTRPFGSASMFACVGRDGPELYMIEPSGVYWRYFGCAMGKGKQAAKTEIEKVKFAEMNCRDALADLARIVLKCHGEEDKAKESELELSWICPESDMQHQIVPKALLAAAEEAAKARLQAEEMG